MAFTPGGFGNLPISNENTGDANKGKSLFGQSGGASLFGGLKSDSAASRSDPPSEGDIFKSIAKSGGFGSAAGFGTKGEIDKTKVSAAPHFPGSAITSNPFQSAKPFGNPATTAQTASMFGHSPEKKNPFVWKKETAENEGRKLFGGPPTTIAANNPFASRKIVIESPSPDVKKSPLMFGIPQEKSTSNIFGNPSRQDQENPGLFGKSKASHENFNTSHFGKPISLAGKSEGKQPSNVFGSPFKTHTSDKKSIFNQPHQDMLNEERELTSSKSAHEKSGNVFGKFTDKSTSNVFGSRAKATPLGQPELFGQQISGVHVHGRDSPMKSTKNIGNPATPSSSVGEFDYRVSRPKADFTRPPVDIPKNIRSPPQVGEKRTSRNGASISSAAKISSKAVKTARAGPGPKTRTAASSASALAAGARNRAQRRRSSSTITDPKMMESLTTLHLQALPSSFNNVVSLRKHFGIFGPINHVTPRPRSNEAFVEFETHESAKKAKQAGTVIKPGTSPIKASWVIPKALISPPPKSQQPSVPMEETAPSQKKREAKKSPPKPIRPLERQNLQQLKDYKPQKSKSRPQMDTQEKPFTVPAGLSSQQIKSMLRDLYGKHCPTSMDKYQLLENRDKILRKGRVKVSDVIQASVVVGECPDMCPEKERYQREVQKRLSSYEIGSDGKVVPELTVQDYSRSSADQDEPLPHELRPSHVLVMTMDYIFGSIANEAPEDESRIPIWHDFIWNRTRAIRKDITQQMLSDSVAVGMVEKCARFHIYAAHRLCEFDRGDFVQKFNTESLNKCLMTLKHFYEDSGKLGINCEHEGEFRAYDVLLNLNDPNILIEVLTYKASVRQSPAVRLAVKLQTALQTRNYVRFFRLVRDEADFLQSSLVHRHFGQLRLDAIRTIQNTYSSVPGFPIMELMLMLGFESPNECVEFCQFYGWNTVPSNGSLLKIDRTAYMQPESPYPPLKRSLSLVEFKATGYSLGEPPIQRKTINADVEGVHPDQRLLTGGSVPPVQLPTPICSFDENGNYTLDPVIATYLDGPHHEPPPAKEAHAEPAEKFSGFRAAGGFGSLFGKASSALGRGFGGPTTPEAKLSAVGTQTNAGYPVRVVRALIQKGPLPYGAKRKITMVTRNRLLRPTSLGTLTLDVNPRARQVVANTKEVVDGLIDENVSEIVPKIAAKEQVINKVGDVYLDQTNRECTSFIAQKCYSIAEEDLRRRKTRERNALIEEVAGSTVSAVIASLSKELVKELASRGYLLQKQALRIKQDQRKISDFAVSSVADLVTEEIEDFAEAFYEDNVLYPLKQLENIRERLDRLWLLGFFRKWLKITRQKLKRQKLIKEFPRSRSTASLQEIGTFLANTC